MMVVGIVMMKIFIHNLKSKHYRSIGANYYIYAITCKSLKTK